VEGDSKEGLLL